MCLTRLSARPTSFLIITFYAPCTIYYSLHVLSKWVNTRSLWLGWERSSFSPLSMAQWAGMNERNRQESTKGVDQTIIRGEQIERTFYISCSSGSNFDFVPFSLIWSLLNYSVSNPVEARIFQGKNIVQKTLLERQEKYSLVDTVVQWYVGTAKK